MHAARHRTDMRMRMHSESNRQLTRRNSLRTEGSQVSNRVVWWSLKFTCGNTGNNNVDGWLAPTRFGFGQLQLRLKDTNQDTRCAKRSTCVASYPVEVPVVHIPVRRRARNSEINATDQRSATIYTNANSMRMRMHSIILAAPRSGRVYVRHVQKVSLLVSVVGLR